MASETMMNQVSELTDLTSHWIGFLSIGIFITAYLLVTLTASVGGSMLSIGSAAGVTLMGQARDKYTFFGHLKWTPAIAASYIASIYVHM